MIQASATPRIALLAGATGLVGSHILQGLIADPAVQAVHVLARRAGPDSPHAKVTWHQVDFTRLPTLPPCTEVYLALGTTIKQAGSQAAFRAVDYDANLAVAQAALAAGARSCGLVSAMGADAKSGIFYNRVKGELEAALQGLGFRGLVIARPSLLVGDRESLQQPPRLGERVGLALARMLNPLIPANYRAVDAAKVAQILLQRVPGAEGVSIPLSGEIQQLQIDRG